MSVRISIVVPTYRRPQMLQRCLEALLAQDYDAQAYEVIVADDGASEETQRVLDAMAARHGRTAGAGALPRLRYLPLAERRGPAAARNAGWRAAAGSIIAFTDDDCVPAPDWLKAGAGAFVDGIVGASGSVVVPLSQSPTDYEVDAARLMSAEFVTANCFYRRDALASIGGFDERFTAPWREDSDVFFSLLERRGRLVRVPEAVVVHPVRSAAWGISLRQQRKTMYNALLFRKHPRLYRERLKPVTPWHYYGAVAALLVALLGGLTQRRRLKWSGAVAWAILTGRFASQRLARTARTPDHVLEMVVTSALIPPVSMFWRVVGALKYRVWYV